MENLSVFSASPNFDGVITIDSSSKISATKVCRADVSGVSTRLSKPGIYMLFINRDSVYVGQSSSSIKNRIFSPHSGGIENEWQSVVAFTCNDHISSDSLLFLENALCEYAHNHYVRCLTSAPAKENCNENFRYSHYNLNVAQFNVCRAFFKDIRDYLAVFSRFVPSERKKIFMFTSKARDSEGRAEIEINCGHKRKREAVLKAGSRISRDVSINFASSQSVIVHRNELISEGKIVDRILQVDLVFPSQSGAGEFLNGTSFDGNSGWKTSDGIRLKELL